MNRKLVVIVCILVLWLAALACVDGGGGGGMDATATFGAEQFHMQLTEVAK